MKRNMRDRWRRKNAVRDSSFSGGVWMMHGRWLVRTRRCWCWRVGRRRAEGRERRSSGARNGCRERCRLVRNKLKAVLMHSGLLRVDIHMKHLWAATCPNLLPMALPQIHPPSLIHPNLSTSASKTTSTPTFRFKMLALLSLNLERTKDMRAHWGKFECWTSCKRESIWESILRRYERRSLVLSSGRCRRRSSRGVVLGLNRCHEVGWLGLRKLMGTWKASIIWVR